MSKKILISGGAGFLGSHLCETLLNDGNEVICLDNFFTGSKNNIIKLMDNPYFEVIRHDVEKSILLEVDEIYNLACPASPIHYQFDPVKTVRTNVLGAINMLDIAKRCKAKIFQASTSEIYGDPEIHPQIESYRGNVNPIGIRACYDEGKRCAETLFFDYHREYNVDIRVARIFNTYGDKMNINDGRVVSNFIVQALQNKDITIYGDGTQSRSFCFVDDLINGFIKLMNNEISVPVNLGNPNEFTMNELAQNILNLTNSKSKIIYKELPQDDPKQRQPDISLAKEKLNWEPKIELIDGLKRTIKYFKDII
jgi:UDP-glucuronate decarboxylase